MQSEVYDDCAFDQQAQEEASLFWCVSDTVYGLDHYGVKPFLDALWVSLSASDKQYIKAYIEGMKV